ncbi:uncharacterized protein BKCO1_500010 [Diplodia corticola]|uniref:BTB domain-containing protein n=1 Tax=Diplodia corticola TaxID=236234 RepID=A0A1J9SE10_9PEZI|nr:uncharacterized protein BKCO1_500010 [Diplodia corticola]OJD38060.1 hypothetical protein BKCO1_500010 [Diplodia corticola]
MATPPSSMPAAERKLTRSSLNFRSSVISVFVAMNRVEPFMLHRDLITATSRLFHQHRFDSVVHLPHETPALFEVYAEWVYSNRSSAILQNLRAHEVVHRADGSGQLDQPGADHLLGLAILGERLRDVTFKNAVVDAYVDMLMTGCICPTHFAKAIYEGLPRGNGFARLYVDVWCWNSDESWFEELEERDDPNSAPGAFWLDVVKRRIQLGRRVYDARIKAPWVANRAQYYEVEGEMVLDDEENAEQAVGTEDDDIDVLVKPEPKSR